MCRMVTAIVVAACVATPSGVAAEGPMKVFVLAGQSNMVGWGDSRKLPEPMRKGNPRVLMFEQGRWQPLRPCVKARKNQEKFGMTEFSFGPEIRFAHEIAQAWPDETIGIIKLAVGGTSILAWKPDWSKQDADRVRQGQHGSLYEKLVTKVKQAGQKRDIELAGFLWLQGGGDMKNVAVAKEYLDNLKSLVAALRSDAGNSTMPALWGTMRRTQDPDDLSDLVPSRVDGPYPAVEYVLKAQWQARDEISNSRVVVLRDIETHPMNVHYNTAGQLQVGRLFATAFLDMAAERPTP